MFLYKFNLEPYDIMTEISFDPMCYLRYGSDGCFVNYIAVALGVFNVQFHTKCAKKLCSFKETVEFQNFPFIEEKTKKLLEKELLKRKKAKKSFKF